MRLKVANLILAALLLALFSGLFNLQVIQAKKFKELSRRNCIRLLPQPAARGRILDRKGEIIVDNYLAYDLLVLPQEENQLDKTLLKISSLTGRSLADLKRAFKNGYSAPFIPVTVVKNIEPKKAIALEESKFNFPAIMIQPRPVRDYLYSRLASHAIGYLNEIDHWRLTKLADYGYNSKDIVGYTGVEEKYDYYLRQQDGALSIEVDHRGKFMRVIGYRPPKNGKDIQLTLDLKLQKIAEKNLNGRKGCVILMHPISGEILSLASSPAYDPVVFIKKSPLALTGLFRNPNSALINRATSGLYPPGSVFKLVVAAAALQTGKINFRTGFFCPGAMEIGRRKFNCWDTHHQEDLIDAIAHSCDVFFYHTGLLLGPQLIHDYALKFGFAKPTGSDLPYETSGFVPGPFLRKIYRFQHWYNGDTANFSIGQGDLLVTPLQISRMVAVFANKGSLVTPYIVKAIDNQNNTVYPKKNIRFNLQAQTIEAIRKGMRRAITDTNGTANLLSTLQISIAGKTGTSQVSQGQPHGWFSGFFPFGEPKFVICVFLEHGGSGYAASLVAKQIIEEMIKEGLV